MKLDFSRGAWNTDDVTYAYTYRFPGTPEFHQTDDCVENRQITEEIYGCDWENISLLSKQTYSAGVRIETRCAFFDLGAPLITIADRIYDENGENKYGDYIEVVLYKNGINVWELWQDESETVQIRNLLKLKTPLQTGQLHDFSLRITKDRFAVQLDDLSFNLYCDKIYGSFHLGFTGCEGPCRFYDLQIEKE